MVERPILFSAPMVRALLDGSKTQTRRVAKEFAGREDLSAILRRFPNQSCCRYGIPGDRLYVREHWRSTGDGGRCDDMPPRDLQPHELWYEADGVAPADQCVGKARRAFHMPKWGSRITLEITDVRVERLQDISTADAIAEGVSVHPDHHAKPGTSIYSPVQAYRDLWEQLNGAGSWDANPWVWVVEFRRLGATEGGAG
jgi:hypothetical protein